MKQEVLPALYVLLAALTLAGCVDQGSEKSLASAKSYLQQNDSKSAIVEIKNALQKNPDLGEARYLLGTTLLMDGKVIEAEVEFRKALAAKHPDYIVVPELAQAMVRLGHAKKLVDEFGNSRLGISVADASLQTSLSQAYGVLGRPAQAQEALDAALSEDANYAPALLTRARQKVDVRDFNGALATIDGVLAREPRNAEAWKQKGDILDFALNKPDEALAAYRKSLDANDTFIPGHLAILTVLMRNGNWDAAAAQLERLKKFAGNNAQIDYIDAQLAYQKKDYKHAKELAQQLVQAAPNNALVLQLAGTVELQAGSVSQAETYFSRAIKVAPEFMPPRQSMIAVHLRSGHAEKALAALNEVSKQGGIQPAMYELAGQVYLQNGDAKRAEEYFAKALKLDPDSTAKRTALAVAHLAIGQRSAGLDELQKIAATDSGTTADMALISSYMRRKEFDQALAAIDRLESKQPDKPVASDLRGRIYLVQKNSEAARKSFERALSLDPGFYGAVSSLAALDLADKKPEEAKKRLRDFLVTNPKNGAALLALARLAAATGGSNKVELEGLLSRAIEANPDEVAPRLLLIRLHAATKDLKKATATAQGAVAALPYSPELLEELALLQQASREWNQAIVTYGKLSAMRPLSPQSQMRLAQVHVANMNSEAAQQSLRKALESNPDFLDAQGTLVMLYLQAEKYPDAMKIARTVQQQRPKAPMGFVMEGDIAAAQKQWVLAEAAFRSALKRGALTESAIKLHMVLLNSGKATESDRFAAGWVKGFPNDAAFLNYLGDSALARSDYELAEKHYLAALKVRPQSAITLNNLAWTTVQLKKDGALAYAQKATELAPDQPRFMTTLAMLLAEDNQSAKAIDLQKRAVGLQPTNPELRLSLARIYIKAGDKGLARGELEQLAKQGATFPRQAEVSALLKTL